MTARATTRTLVSRPQPLPGSTPARSAILFPGHLPALPYAAGWWRLGVAAVTLAGAALMPQAPAHAYARADADAAQVVDSARASAVALSALPRQARDTHQRILAGGPFEHGKDGTVFGNRERLLPRHKRGYWREYTVPTPGVRHRGARRIVCGGLVVQSPETCFYTQDHYQSFQKIDPTR